MASLSTPLKSAFVFSYGLLTMAMYALIAISAGIFFKNTTEKETVELQLARNRLWNLSKKWSAFSHQIFTLQNGFKFHYVCNDPDTTPGAKKPLVIFIHGFPDSWAIWRHIINAESLQSTATVVAVDLPGYGGSESLDRYSATTVLENLTEFIIAMRSKYGIDSAADTHQQRTIIVGHDWGCVISMRLATDAPQLADRFILTNGPLIPLVKSNANRLLSSSLKMFKAFLRSPIRSRALLVNAAKTLMPILDQMKSSGYVFSFQLPRGFVEYLGTGGNRAFLKLCHKVSYGSQEFTPTDAAECMASTLGPSVHEGENRTTNGEGYAESVVRKRALSNFFEMCSYYRDGTAFSRWNKSVETITALHNITQEHGPRDAGSGAGIFNDGPKGSLKASATILWGKKDNALTVPLCLDGIADYLGQDSQVIELPGSGHFTPLERGSRIALSKAVEWAVKGEREDIGAVMEACYPKATVIVRK
ncbi:Alpha/Beta hydrolase protein [Aspergillus cavernicola]|uniref:Alpha/Beta hydrolase protein n=1 Tax=Aspergillus cavernicola TaxID=176166 RepID=A0ABR4IGJ2_9EURO